MFRWIGRAIAALGIAGCLVAASVCHSTRASSSSEETLLPPADGVLRVLILSGQGDHDWRATTPFLRRLLAGTGRFDVRVCEAPAGLTAQTLADFDVLVDEAGAAAQGGAGEKAIAGFVASGKGLVVTHGGLAASTSAGRHTADGQARAAQPESTETTQEYWPALPSGGSHSSPGFWEVRIDRPEHPIVQGMTTGYKAADAPYRGLANRASAVAIAVAKGDAGSGGGGNEQPVLVASAYGKGRVFGTALGHDLAAMHEKEFITTFARGTEWAATGAVTLPADLGLPGPRADAVKGLLITGGHDHETSFYALFDGYQDLARTPVASSATAFAKDLRGKYDVIIMYDFSRDLDETGKKNLREFVEAGKGVVVLHHALLNYQRWPWWYEEVVGGSYRLQSEGKVLSSTVKDGQQMFVTPQAHAITAGISPFRIVDESYKRMWFSPRVQPLLLTDNPSSDHFLAWVGPGTARGLSRFSSATGTRPLAIPHTGRSCTTPSCGRRDGSSDARACGRVLDELSFLPPRGEPREESR